MLALPTEEETVIEAMVKYEGMNIDEAKLTYKSRENLPNSAFCGKNRTYPAHDAAHVRNGLSRLSRFGRKLAPVERAKILACLKRRAKAFGVEISESYRWTEEGEESPTWVSQTSAIVKAFLEKKGIKCKTCPK